MIVEHYLFHSDYFFRFPSPAGAGLNEYAVLYSFQNDVGGFLVEVLFYLEAVCPAVAVCCCKQGCSATGAGVDDDISGVGEYLDETGK